MPLAVAAAMGAAWIVLALLPAGALKPDSVVAVATLAYFSGVHSHRKLPAPMSAVFSKEFLVGALFTAGCVLPVWSQSPQIADAASPHRLLLAPMLFFAALAWLNCRAIGRWESNHQDSGIGRVLPVAIALGAIGLLLAASVAAVQPRSAALLGAGAVSALLLAALDRLRFRITPLALRAAADLVLLTPVLLAPFALRHG